MLQLNFLKELAKTHPATARLVELSIYGAVGYMLGAIYSGDPFSVQALIQAALAPVMAAIAKRQRDLEK